MAFLRQLLSSRRELRGRIRKPNEEQDKHRRGASAVRTHARTNTCSSAKAASRERVCLAPQSVCHPEWINADLCPPCCFVATSMNFAVMSTAQWDRELITHLASERSALCKSEVVRIGRTPAANQTGMSCDEFHMLSIAKSSRLRMGRTAFFDPLDSGSFGRLSILSAQATLRACALIQRAMAVALYCRPQVLALPTSPGTHSPTAAHLRRSRSS